MTSFADLFWAMIVFYFRLMVIWSSSGSSRTSSIAAT